MRGFLNIEIKFLKQHKNNFYFHAKCIDAEKGKVLGELAPLIIEVLEGKYA